jgi:hypothetical protein
MQMMIIESMVHFMITMLDRKKEEGSCYFAHAAACERRYLVGGIERECAKKGRDRQRRMARVKLV